MEDPKFWTVREVADLARLSIGPVYALVKSGQLEATRAGKSIRIPDHAVRELLRLPAESSPQPPAPTTISPPPHRAPAGVLPDVSPGRRRGKNSSLANLRRAYGRAYYIRGDNELGFMATRRDDLSVLRGATYDEMLEFLVKDYNAHPVPHEYDAPVAQPARMPASAPGMSHDAAYAERDRLRKKFSAWAIWFTTPDVWYARPDPGLCEALNPKAGPGQWTLCRTRDKAGQPGYQAIAGVIEDLQGLHVCPFCGEEPNPLPDNAGDEQPGQPAPDPGPLVPEAAPLDGQPDQRPDPLQPDDDPLRLPADEPLLSPGEVARMARVGRSTITKWANQGKLTAIRPAGEGGHRRYRESEVRALLGLPPKSG